MLLFCDSFDHYEANPSMGYKWTSSSHGFGNVATHSATGRFGTYGLYLNGWIDRHILKALGANYATLIVGCAIQIDALVNTGVLLRLLDAGSNQLELRVNSSGGVYVTRNGTTLATSAGGLVLPNVYNYFEIKATIHNSAGEVEVRLNGTTVISATGLDTQNTANAYANEVAISQNLGSFQNNLYADDFYVCDDSGGVNDDFLGDVRVECLKPSGNGNSSQFDGSDGNTTDNYLLVDDPNDIDDDSTYVQSPDVGDKDTYAHGDLTPTAGTVHGVQISLTARKTDAGTRQLVSVARLSGGTEADSAAHTLASSYTGYRDIRETKPGGGAWSISDVNGAEFGQKVAA